MRGGKRAGAGRPKGARSKISAARKAEIAASGEMPLDYALRIMRDEGQPSDRRDWGCSQAMPYCHSRLQAIEVGGKGGGAIAIKITQDDARL